MYVGRDEGLSKLRPFDLLKAAFGVCEISWRRHTGRFARLQLSEDGAAATVPPTERSVEHVT